MKTFEDYKAALMEQPGPYMRDKLLDQAEADGLTVWELAALIGFRGNLWT